MTFTVGAGEAVAELMVKGGVRRMYTVPGESFLEILDGVDRHPDLRLISTRHEGGAAFMAEADAKVSGHPAVVAATRGVGAANLAIGIHTAYQDSTPMIVCLGQVETSFMYREAFQEVDLPAFLSPISKHAVTVHRTDRIPELFADALRIATSGRPGPVVLAFPADVLGHSVERSALDLGLSRIAPPVATPVADLTTMQTVARRLDGARQPVIIAGAGARAARAELQAVAERFSAGVYSAFRRQDVFDNAHPLYLGPIGLGAHPRHLAALRDADLVLVVGSRLNEITTARYTLPSSTSAVIHIDIDEAVIGAVTPVEVGVVSDARAALRLLVDVASAGPGPDRDWTAAREAYLMTNRVGPSRARPQTGCDPAVVMAMLARACPLDTLVANDAGNFSAFLHRHWVYTSPGSCVGAANGAMGYGVPAAIGAKLARPERPVVGVVGDGGFLMTGFEMETAVRYELDVTVVVLRNGLHGTIAMHQARDIGRLAGTDIGPVDFVPVAKGLGAWATAVDTEADLAEAFGAAVRHPGPAVVEVRTDPDLIAPDETLNHLMRQR
jgi:acetolactate synthase-1/2/3 large subunit